MSAPAPSMFTPAAKTMAQKLGLKMGRANLEEFAANPWQEIYIEPFTTVDLTARVSITPQIQLRLEGRNILGANRQRNTGLHHEYYRAGLEVGNSWFFRVNYRL